MLSLDEKSSASIIIAVLSLLAIIFCVLWQHTVHDQSDFTTFTQAEANKAYTSFSTYIQCRDGVYWTLKKQLVASLSSLGKGSTCLSNGAAYKSEHMKPPFDDDFAC